MYAIGRPSVGLFVVLAPTDMDLRRCTPSVAFRILWNDGDPRPFLHVPPSSLDQQEPEAHLIDFEFTDFTVAETNKLINSALQKLGWMNADERPTNMLRSLVLAKAAT
jgi:hypothetical protein